MKKRNITIIMYILSYALLDAFARGISGRVTDNMIATLELP